VVPRYRLTADESARRDRDLMSRRGRSSTRALVRRVVAPYAVEAQPSVGVGPPLRPRPLAEDAELARRVAVAPVGCLRRHSGGERQRNNNQRLMRLAHLSS
jgi:hypothetical protein